MKYSRGDGSFWSFGFNGTDYSSIAPANGGARLTQGDSFWVLTYKNGERRTFANSSGSLTSIIDRNGNTTQLSYDGLNRLTSVTDPAGRHLYFAYANTNYPYLITSTTSDVGISLSYVYDTQGRLLTVTRPDASVLAFEYDAHSLITSVKDGQGKVLEAHTYDSVGRGLTSTRANGVDSVTVTYPQ